MPDDYTDTSNDRTVSRDEPHEPETTGSRIAIRARSQDAADALWQGIENRIRKKAMMPVLRVQASEAEVGIYLLAWEDFADDETARATVTEILSGIAARNILFEPQAESDPEIRYRMTKALADFAARPGYLRLASQEQAGTNSVPYQARAILRLLQAKSAGSEPDVGAPAEHSDQARTKALKREARGARKKGDEAGTGPRKRANKRASGKATPGETEPSTEKSVAAPAGGTDRAGKRAQKRATKKAEKAQRAATDPIAATEMVPSAAKDRRAEKRARKRAAKGDRSAKSGRRKAGKSPRESAKDAAAPDLAVRSRAEARAENRAQRKALKEAAGKKSADTGKVKRKRAGDEDAGAKTAIAKSAPAKQKSPKAPSPAVEPRPRALSLAVAGMGDASKAALSQSLQRLLKDARGPMGLSISDKKRDIAIYAFDETPLASGEIAQRASVIAGDGARVRIFLERASPSVGILEDENRAIAGLAGACGGSLVRLAGKFQRYGDGVMIANGQFTQAGWDLVASSVLGILTAQLSKFFPKRPQPPAPPDLLEARALAARAPEFLAQLSWSKSSAPKSLGTGASKAAMDPLIEEKLALSPERIFDLRSPVAWPEEISDRLSAIQILGLEFLTGPLSYWYDKAAGRNSSQIAEIDAALKEREIKASEILSRAEKLMTGFVEKYPSGALPAAWHEDAVSRRARVFTLYALCCKLALKRRVRFDAEAFAAVFVSLFDLIEILRADDFYKPASAEGYEQDFLLIALGLALRGTAYGDRLFADSLERFRLLQLEAGLTSDGVWRAGPFSEHGALLSGLRVLMGDLEKSASASLDSFAAVTKKMTVFAEAMLKSNGQPPMIDGRKQKSYGKHLSGARRALAQASGKSVTMNKIAAMPRLTDTYVFRDAQYFISHSTQKASEDSSLVVLHADAASFVNGDPGGATLIFARGQTDLLIRAAPPELANKKDRSPLFDPALRNGYHVDGTGFAGGGAVGQGAARIVKSWRGPGWAAAKSMDGVNNMASVSRVVVHLKAVHALIVVDELDSRTGTEHDFEQFWHIAPGLASASSGEVPLRFDSEQTGGMSVAFDPRGETATEAEGEGICLRRRERLAKGSLASLFQWSESVAPVAIEFVGGEIGGWTVSASGVGFKARLMLRGDEFVCEISSGG